MKRGKEIYTMKNGLIDAGSLAQRKRARHACPPPSFSFKFKKDYCRKSKHKGKDCEG